MELNKILKSDYLDILFEGRNKSYGGYELRKKYPQRVRNSLFIVGGIFLLLMGYSVLANMKPKEVKKEIVSMKTVTLAEPPPMEPNKPKPPPPPPAPPPPVKPQVKFVPPVVTRNEEVKETERPPDPPKPGSIAGPADVKGVDNGADIAAPPTAPAGAGTGTEPAKPVTTIFHSVEQMPKFNGDLTAWLQNHVEYPDAQREAGTEGKAYIQFVVSEDGSVTQAEVLKSSGSTALDNEALRVVKLMPKWKPGVNNGQNVKVYYSVPVTFVLQ